MYQTTTAQQSEDGSKQKPTGVPAAKNAKDQPNSEEPEYIIGPIRVLPGRLSVSRTFGDPEAKLAFRGGSKSVVISEPQIKEFKI